MKFFATVLLATAVYSKCSKNEVCGKDGETYKNDCELKDADVKLASCVDCKSAKKFKPKGGVCPNINATVCGNDDISYTNECFLDVAKTKLKSCGECKSGKKP